MTLRKYLQSGASTLANPDLLRSNKYMMFGWYWEPTERVNFLVEELGFRGKIGNIWNTPQMDAVCWLIRKDSFPLPTVFDPLVHEMFCLIASLYLMFGIGAPSTAEMKKTLKDIQKAKRDLKGAIRNLEYKSNQLKNMFSGYKKAQSDLETALESINQIEDFLGGAIEWPKKVSGLASGSTGTSQNWAARVVATRCADIYFSAFGKSPEPNDGNPSFRTFYTKFSIGFPDAEKSDAREIARMVERSGYTGKSLEHRGRVLGLPE